MSITTFQPSPPADTFAVGAGRPSRIRTMTLAEHLDSETLLVETLRAYTVETARHCQHDTPPEYADFVDDLTEVEHGDALTSGLARMACLLFIYADYIPSPDCDFIDLADGEYHGWQAPDGRVVIDLVTTLTMTELALDQDTCSVAEATMTGRVRFGNLFAGVRLIVLDAPYESTWHPAVGHPQPLLTSDITPVVTEAGDFR